MNDKVQFVLPRTKTNLNSTKLLSKMLFAEVGPEVAPEKSRKKHLKG